MRHAVLFGLLLAFAPLRAAAQASPSPDQRAAYREQIGKALQEYALGHWAEARVFFADAHAIWPNARTFRGLGMAAYEAREYSEAIEFLEQALVHHTQPLTPKLAGEARSVLEQATRFVATLRFELEPADAQVSIDDKPLRPRADGSVLLNGGQHQLLVEAPGFLELQRTFTAEAGETSRLRLKLVSLTPAEPPRTEPVVSAPVTVAPSVPVEPAPKARKVVQLAHQQPVAAAILAGVGFSSLAVGWVLFALRDALRVELWQDTLLGTEQGVVSYERSTLQRYRVNGGVALAAAGAGSLFLAYAQYLALPEPDEAVRVPAWAWVAGAAGAAIGVTGLVLALSVQHCEVGDAYPTCQNAQSDPYFGPLLAIHALPFLTLPIMYLVRPRTSTRTLAWSVSATSGPRGHGLQLQGTF